LTGGYLLIRSRVYREIDKINRFLTSQVRPQDLSISLLPPAVMVNDIKGFTIKTQNLVSFDRVSLEIPFYSLFSAKKEVNLSIVRPRLELGGDIFSILDEIIRSTRKKTPQESPLKLQHIRIKQGQVIYRTEKLAIDLLDFDLSQTAMPSGKKGYRLSSPHLKVIFPLSGKDVKIEGNLTAEFREQDGNYRINRFLWNTEFVDFKLNGRVLKDKTVELNISLQGSLKQVLDPLLGHLSIREFQYGSVKIRKNKGDDRLTVSGDFTTPAFSVGGQMFDNLRGLVRWDNIENKIKVDAFFTDGSLNGSLKVESFKGDTQVQVKNATARKIARAIMIEDVAPICGVLKDSDFLIGKKHVSGWVEFDRQPVPGGKEFNMKGFCRFAYDGSKKAVQVSAAEVQTEFGWCNLELNVDPTNRESLVLHAQADLTEAAGIDKYTQFYIGLSLSPWKLKGGQGKMSLDVKRVDHHISADSDFIIQDFSSSDQPVQYMKGQIITEGRVTRGTLSFRDKDLEGRAELEVEPKTLDIAFKNVRGQVQKILKILGFNISLSGRMTGDFTYQHRSGEKYPLVQGIFRGERVNFYDFIFQDLTGNLEAREYLALKNVQGLYGGGKVGADVFIDYSGKVYRINGQIDGIAIKEISPGFSGTGDIRFSGQGAFNTDPILVDYRAGDFSFYQGRAFALKGKARIFTDFSNYRLLVEGDFSHKSASSPFTLELNQQADVYSGAFDFLMKDINFIIPWGDNSGDGRIRGQIVSTDTGGLSAEGHATFSGRVLSFPNFPHAMDDFEADIIFTNLHFTLRSLSGTMGGGRMECQGRVDIEDGQLKNLSLDLLGKKMRLYPMDRTSCLMDTRDLTLRYVDGRLLLQGDLLFSSILWGREVDEPIVFNTDPSLAPAGSGILGALQYDLHLIGKEDIRIDTGLVKGQGQFDLRLSGNPRYPRLSGLIEGKQGYLEVADNKFEIIKARVKFSGKAQAEPTVDVDSETLIKNYRIKFTTKGTYSRLKPEFQSSPPLPPRDILTLLSLGELFRRPSTTELRSQLGEGTSGLIAAEITDQIKKRTKKIFGDYVLKIDPNISNITGTSLEDTSRVIIGKSIAPNFLIVYSTNFSTQRQQVLYFQYQLTSFLSLIGMRNEEGRFSIDIRFRKRH